MLRSLTILILCTQMSYFETMRIKLIAYDDNVPYYIANYSRHTHTGKGMITQVTKAFHEVCDSHYTNIEIDDRNLFHSHDELMTSITTENTENLYDKYNISRHSTDEVVIFGTTTLAVLNEINVNITPTTLIMSPGTAVVVQERSILQIKKFFKAIELSLLVIYTAIMFAIITGCIIWLFEHNINPQFPKSFGRGLWSGFWFCIVTMTTVGYGDKVPKHVISKLVSIAWQIYGVVLTACITAAVMNEIGNDINLAGERIAVLNGTNEMLLGTEQLKGEMVFKKSYSGIIEAIENDEVKAGLIEANTAAFIFNNNTYSRLAVERVLKFETPVYLFVLKSKKGPHLESFIHCIRFHQDILLRRIKAQFIPPLKITPFVVQSVSKSIQYSNSILLFSTTIIAGILVATAVLFEIIVSLVKRRKSSENGFTKPMIIRHKLKEQIKNFKQAIEELEDELTSL